MKPSVNHCKKKKKECLFFVDYTQLYYFCQEFYFMPMQIYLIVLGADEKKQLAAHLGISKQFMSHALSFARHSMLARKTRCLAVNQYGGRIFKQIL